MTSTGKSFEEQLPEALARTGFVVEHEVAEAFRLAKWNVIGSRYYVDDVDGKARELDMIAYKVSSGTEIDVVTSILVSCKKDTENAWVVMSRQRPNQDPNIDWNPVQPWTNNDVLGAFLGSSDWSKDYVCRDKELHTGLFDLKRQAFAFQLVSLASCSPKNDRPIFESLTDLMKAQDHELSLLPERMKKQRLYMFNLMTIVDAPLYEARYDEKPVQVAQVEEFRHLARYIVNRRARVARINIYNKAGLPKLVKTYDRLAQHDLSFFDDKVKEAYSAIKTNEVVRDVLAKAVSKKLKWEIYIALLNEGKKGIFPETSLGFDSKTKELLLYLPLESSAIDLISRNSKLTKKTAEILSSVARYQGKFRFEEEIPF